MLKYTIPNHVCLFLGLVKCSHTTGGRDLFESEISLLVGYVIWNIPSLQGDENLVMSTWEPKSQGYGNIFVVTLLSMVFNLE